MRKNGKRLGVYYHTDTSYGLHKWLKESGHCLTDNGKINPVEYADILERFALHSNPKFRLIRSNKKIQSLENYASNRFESFKEFVKNKNDH